MNNKIILSLLFTILILNPLFALDCQYTQSVFDHTEILTEPYSVDYNEPVVLITYSIQKAELAPIYFFNKNDFDVDIEFDVTYNAPGGLWGNYRYNTIHKAMTLPPGNTEMRFAVPGSDKYKKGYYDSISNLYYKENQFVYLKDKEVDINKEICKICGDKNCLNDGVFCSTNLDCGSGNCVEGVCSIDKNCHNNNCNCDSMHIEYNDSRCIEKQTVKNGEIPLTNNSEECISKYIDSNTGKCSFSPEQKQQNIKNIIFLVVLFLIIGGIIYMIYRKKKNTKKKVNENRDSNSSNNFNFLKKIKKYKIFNIFKPILIIFGFIIGLGLFFALLGFLASKFIILVFLIFPFYFIVPIICGVYLSKYKKALFKYFIISVIIFIFLLVGMFGLITGQTMKTTANIILYTLIFCSVIILFVYIFGRVESCPKCKKSFARRVEEREILNSRISTETVRRNIVHTDSRGRQIGSSSYNETIPVTISDIRIHNKCIHCGHKWTVNKTIKE